jgi:hypothetical protein
MTPTEPIEHQIPTPELVGIGHAIVDILAYKDKRFLENNGFTLGSMQLIDDEQVAKLTPLMGAANGVFRRFCRQYARRLCHARRACGVYRQGA